ncbi:MAG: hypothetical protein Q8M02_13120 [Candidatus Didemnitutus sp.]|nr:hypothetical protein [Candidatus Didemnitutus sp.]
MPTPLKSLGPPVIGRGIQFGFRAESGVSPTQRNNRIITRDYEMRVEDQAEYIVALENPTTLDPVFTNAVIVAQSVREKAGDNTVCYLRRVFAEVPQEWDEFIDRVETFPGVALSALYAPAEFYFRNSQTTLRSRCRLNRRYSLGHPEAILEHKKFQAFDADGVATSVINDYTTPSADEYIAMVYGRNELVMWSVPRKWMGDIYVLETLYAQAK